MRKKQRTKQHVARRVRAWIETAVGATVRQCLFVARRVRAWIETIHYRATAETCTVARRVRAWIETFALWRKAPQGDWSPAVCGRGLKPFADIIPSRSGGSPAVCGRGLKQKAIRQKSKPPVVARRVRAWIETGCQHIKKFCGCVARRVRAWIETKAVMSFNLANVVARRVRAWIETGWTPVRRRRILSPAVCGRGLKQVRRKRTRRTQ